MPVGFREGIGSTVQELRERGGVTADDVAIAARRLGFGWYRSTISMLESGRRGLTAEEFIALPAILETASIHVTYADLLRQPLQVSEQLVVDAGLFDQMAHPRHPGQRKAWLETSPDEWRVSAPISSVPEAEYRAARSLGIDYEELASRSLRLWGRSFLEERDRRVAEEGGNPLGARRWATRRMLEELRRDYGER